MMKNLQGKGQGIKRGKERAVPQYFNLAGDWMASKGIARERPK
jgi:hypothetical protein